MPSTHSACNAYAGRLLKPSDDEKGAAPVAVMSYRTWQQKFGQDPSVIGASFRPNGQPFTIVGITPPGFLWRAADERSRFFLDSIEQ